ncbi:MAG: hypothetical protein NZ610_08075 [Candidatus Bipolaricaulota bacterium]|nr:hypothetical protein [Candidatus Bipolaricaulota bacterium]MCS7275333.1 hypothetical protein [Candidatus Bipolaricaulota bacterium]MDW8110168.1 hypothetical protein [Candidatus Bipolaricaulota bacterium]MDW8329200.1 hypothetical protein [Candidatus Bipolaricaulota bacterium]
MWKALYVATAPDEARAITQALEEQRISYQVEPGPTPDSIAISVQESDFQTAEALVNELSEASGETALHEQTEATIAELLCVRCAMPLRYKGQRSLQVGFWATGHMDVSVYVCPRCQRLEFFEPGVRSFESEDTYEALCRKASQLIDQGRLEEAISVYEHIAERFPHIPGALEETQRCIAVLQQRLASTEAEQDIERLPLGSRERYEALRRKATQLRRNGHWQAALEVYQQIMREFPNDLTAWEEADRSIRELQERLKQ